MGLADNYVTLHSLTDCDSIGWRRLFTWDSKFVSLFNSVSMGLNWPSLMHARRQGCCHGTATVAVAVRGPVAVDWFKLTGGWRVLSPPPSPPRHHHGATAIFKRTKCWTNACCCLGFPFHFPIPPFPLFPPIYSYDWYDDEKWDGGAVCPPTPPQPPQSTLKQRRNLSSSSPRLNTLRAVFFLQ